MEDKSIKTKLISWFAAIIVITVLFLLSSCPPQIDDDLLKQVKDELGPTIKINSPEDGDSYAATVVVSGKVEDATTDDGDTGEVESLAFEVKATNLGDTVDFNDKGKFSFSFETKGLSGSLTVTVTAEDKNGNSTETSITLEDSGAIPSFSAKPGNHRVKLSWNDVPMADSYTLYYTTNGTLPSENYGSRIDNVTSPYSMSSLENGELHVFKLKANSSEGEDNWSHVEYAIPLSERTLAPRVYDEYEQISLMWNDIPATDEYEVYRSTSSKGTYINISGIIDATSFTDTTVQENQNYFYKIKPALDGSLLSAAGFGKPDPFRSTYPFQCGNCDTPGNTQKVHIDGSYAYIAESPGLQVIDVSTPSSPYIRDSATVSPLHSVFDVDVASVAGGKFAYLAGIDYGVLVFNVTNPSAISFLSNFLYSDPDQAWRIDADTGYLYVADMINGLEIFYIHSSGSLFSRGAYQYFGDQAFDVAVTGNNACVVFGSNGVVVVDVSSKWSPSYSKIYQTTDFIEAVAASGNYAYIVDDGEFVSIDITGTDPLSATGTCVLETGAQDITVSGSYAFVTGEGVIYIIDISAPTNPRVIGSQQTSGDAAGVGADTGNEYAFVADGSSGLKVFDLYIPDSPSLGTVESTDGLAKGISLYGNYAFAAVNSEGLESFDISNPSSPVSKDRIDSDGYSSKVELCGDYAFVADGGTGLQIVDISDPTDMVKGAVCDTPETAQDIALKGDYAVIADYGSGIQIIDISDVTVPEIISSYNTPGYARGVEVYGDYAFVADDSEGLKIVDISDPYYPTLKGSISPPDSNLNARTVAIRGNYAYVGYRSSGGGTDPVLQTVDISDPSSPVETAATVTGDDVYFVTVRGSYAFVASTEDGGFELYSLFNPSSPVLVADLDTDGSAQCVDVRGGYAYVADDDNGLQVVVLEP